MDCKSIMAHFNMEFFKILDQFGLKIENHILANFKMEILSDMVNFMKKIMTQPVKIHAFLIALTKNQHLKIILLII
jgi:hypothetical protein